MTREEVKRIAEDYLYYLKIGAFRNVSVEKDIEACSDFIEVLDKPFLRLHNEATKAAYIEKANSFKNSVLSRETSKEIIDIKIIKACEKVIKNPNYKNCTELDDILELIYPDENYGGVVAENKEQEFIHRKLWRYIDRMLRLLKEIQRGE